MRFGSHHNHPKTDAGSSLVNHPRYDLIVNWAAVLVWMIVIFIFSTDHFSSARTTPVIAPFLSSLFPGLAEAHIENIGLSLRKLGHWSEYFILAVLLMRALSGEFSRLGAKRLMLWSVAFAVMYAVSDELHQSFVPSRSASAVDVSIDAIGAICGTLSSYWRNRRMRTDRETHATARA